VLGEEYQDKGSKSLVRAFCYEGGKKEAVRLRAFYAETKTTNSVKIYRSGRVEALDTLWGMQEVREGGWITRDHNNQFEVLTAVEFWKHYEAAKYPTEITDEEKAS
jgi:hypothetical protein